MLKKLKKDNIDNIMELWKEEIIKSGEPLKNKIISEKYTDTKNNFISNMLSTTIYTEDGILDGFISINSENEIWIVLIKSNIRREGIGTILVNNLKQQYKNLKVKVPINNKIALNFFKKNGFQKVEEVLNEKKYVLEWKKQENNKVSVIYFDDDIEKDFITEGTKINYKCIKMKEYLIDEKNDIKTYMNIRKKIEEVMNTSKILLYINYSNYYNFLDEQIKEISKIKKIDLNIVICEPFSIESSKKSHYIDMIEQAYKDYKIYKIDCYLDINENISLNQIFSKRSEILVKKIETIAENM